MLVAFMRAMTKVPYVRLKGAAVRVVMGTTQYA